MKIHTSVIQQRDLIAAVAQIPGVWFERFGAKGSRSRSVAYEITLSSDGQPDQHGTPRRRKVNAGTSRTVDRFGRPHAASWADWGHLLGYLYALDPDMVTPYYADRDDFDRRTGGRFVYGRDSAGQPYLSPLSAKRLGESSVNLSIFELGQHGW